jgi:filamentous hemagglutinin family protein
LFAQDLSVVESSKYSRARSGRGKRHRHSSGWRRLSNAGELCLRLVLGAALTGSLPIQVFANPQGGAVTEGSATIQQSGNRVDVHQATDRAVIDWRSFSIAPGEITQFHQPSAGSIALNRVTGADPSRIFGTLRANGRVFLINPNGIMFGAGSRVDVSGLVATTSNIRNEDFMAGRMEFSIPSLNPQASVVNEGDISIADAGYAALVAPHVRNSGVINARLGRVTLGAADAFAIDLYGDDLVTFRVGVGRTPVDADGNPVDSLIDNQGSILAGGGIVRLATHNVEAVVRNVINTDGVIYANTIERRDGKIILGAAGKGAISAKGELSATGGSIEIAGNEDISLSGTRIAATDVAINADADKSGAGDLNAGTSGGDAILTDIDIDTAAGNDEGGRVVITGDRVAILGASTIDASGEAGGGEILIGGDFQGNGVTRNADATIVGEDVRLKADALEFGNGGRVILWADGFTRFHGAISAIAGLTAGDGGFTEVSGKQNLDFQGSVDVTAAAGEIGTLLLDPVDIIVSADNTDGATGTGLGSILFADAPGLNPWNVSPAALDAVSGNILLQATNDITISNDINLTTLGATFTATANNDIIVNAGVTTNNAAITLTADDDGSGVGELTIAASQTVTSGNNAVNISANDVAFTGGIDSGTGTTTILISDGGTIKLGGTPSGNMTISGSELQNITAANLIIGDATNGNIEVKNVSAAESNNVGTVTLNATKAGATVDMSTGGGNVFNALVINADAAVATKILTTDTGGLTINSGNGVTISDNVTSAGATVIDADTDNNGTGTFTVTSTFALNTAGNSLSITADDINIAGTINTGAAATTILISDAGTIGFGNSARNMTISGAELQNITATGLTIGDATNGDITVDGISAANSNNITGTVTLNATNAAASISISNAGSTFNALTANAANTITGNIPLVTDTGALTLTAGAGITFNDTVTTAGAAVFDADSDNNGTGDFTLSNALNTSNNTLTITANDVVLSNTINTGTAATTILISDGGTIGLGATAGGMTISGAELQNITATGLTVGDATSGNITVNGITAANSNNISGTVTLNATQDNATLSFSGAASTFNAIAANADDGISISQNISTDVGGLALDGDADNAADINDNLTFSAGVTLSSFGNITLDATIGNMSGAGALTLNARSGLTFNDSLATAGATALNADTNNNGSSMLTLAAGAALATGGNTLSITASDINVLGTITSGAAATTILVSAGGSIGLGATAGSMTIDGTELQNITANGLTIGDTSAGNITVNGITAANSNNITGTTSLVAGSNGAAVTFATAASTFNALTASGDNRVIVNVAITTDAGDLDLNGDLDNAADTNDDIAIAAGLTLTSAGSIKLAATNTGISASGALTLNAQSGVTLNDSLVVGGAAVIDTDTDNNGIGDFTINASRTLTTNNNTLTITANDLALSGALNSGSAATTVLTSDGASIGLGATAGGMTIDGAELQNITATGLTIGDSTTGGITVDGITAANSNNITGTVTLNAAADNATASFVTTASTFNALDVNADDRISVNVNITTDIGDLALDGNVDNAADVNDDIAFAAGVTLSSAGSLTLDATTGNMTSAGGLTLNANNSVTLNDTLTTAGATVIDADDDTNGSGTFIVVASKTVNSTNNSLQIVANKIDLAGELNSGTQSTTLTATNGAAIDLGSATDIAANTFELSNSELQSITAANLTIGDGTAGAITVSADVTPGNAAGANVITLNLVTGSTMTASAGAIIETNLSVVAAGAVTFSAATTDTDVIAIDTSTGDIAYTDIDGFTVDTVGAVTGVDTAAGAITLIATTGNIIVANTAAANDIGATGLITLKASADNAAINILTGADTESTGGAHSYTADDIEISGTITATGQDVTLASSTAGDAIDVGDPGGGGDNVANTLELAGAELQNITATNLNIGGAAAGNMTIEGISAANSNNISGLVTLTANGNGSTVTFQNAASTFNALSAHADDRLAVDIDVTTDVGNMTLDADSDDAADTNDDLVFAAGVTITSAGSLTLAATTGGITGTGALTLDAQNGLSVGNAYTGSGNAAFNADSDGNSAGNFTATTMALGANTLNVTGASVNTGTSLAAGTTTLNGAVTGSGLTVTALTLTGASATLTGTTIGGQSGNDAAAAATMPDAATHTINGCQNTRCVVAVVTPTPPPDLDNVQVDTGGTGGIGTGGTGGSSGGTDTGGSTDSDTSGGDTGGSETGDTSGGDTSGGDSSDGGGSTTNDNSGGGTSGGDTSSPNGSSDDVAGGDSNVGDSGGGWSDGSFNAASGDVLLTGSVGNFEVFFEALKEDGASTLELLEASENLENTELASLVKALGDILGEYEFVSTSIPTNAFDDKATTLLPGLLTFDPAATGNDTATSPASRKYQPPSFGRFQF